MQKAKTSPNRAMYSAAGMPQICCVSAVAASIVLAAGRGTGLAVGVWLVMAARAVGAIPFVRVQIVRLRRGEGPVAQSDLAQIVSVAVATAAVIADRPQAVGANLGFASAVAEAGMVLRRSPHAGDASLSSAIARARKFRGDDAEGYRAEFIRLMEAASAMPKRPSTR